ncbi:MAG: sigma-54-dependent Fis family transcriptional regulator [Bacteroidota bacterium]
MSKQIKHSEDLFEFAKILSYQTDFNEVLRLVAHQSTQFLKADLALILMVNPDTRETVKTVIRDGKYSEHEEYRKIHINVGGWIINYQKTYLSKDIHKDNRFLKGQFNDVNIKSVVGVPLVVEGIVIGTLLLLYKNKSEYANKKSIEYLEKIALISTPFLRNVQKLRQYFNSTTQETILLLKYKNAGLLGKSPKFIELLHAVEAATKCDVRVLLDGKTGTGKELVAKSIHKFSSRVDLPFIAIDCGAIPSTIIESELFGHKRGAFTGADSDRNGLFLKANGGTLFMDEINNLPFDLQSKLLRVIEDGEVRPVGSDESFKTNVRIITASSSSLKTLVENNKFREDLFYRLHVYPVNIPDLSERQEDIPLLANHFLNKFAKQQNKKAENFHEEIIDFIKQRTWKGNIRELENFIERIVTVTPLDVSTIEISFFPNELKKETEDYKFKISSAARSTPIKEQIDKYEAEIIKKALIESEWNQSKAARKLQTSESNIRYKITQFNIQRDDLE